MLSLRDWKRRVARTCKAAGHGRGHAGQGDEAQRRANGFQSSPGFDGSITSSVEMANLRGRFGAVED
jgi:hypothetical protein